MIRGLLIKLFLALLVIAFLASLFLETIIPLVRRGDYIRLVATSSGLIMVLLGLFLLLRSLFILVYIQSRESPEREEAWSRIEERLWEIRSSDNLFRKLKLYLKNVQDAVSFLAAPLVWFLLGMALILIGSYLMNI